MKTWILILTLSLFAASCGEKTAVTKAKVTVAGIISALSTHSNFLISMFNPKTGELRRVVMTSDSLDIALSNGSWIFAAYHWEVGAELEGTFRCAKTQANLEGGDLALKLVLSQAECLNHSSATFIDNNLNLQEIVPIFCDDSLPAGGDCDGIEGVTQSYRLVLPEITSSQVTAPAFSKTKITSDCITVNAGMPSPSAKFFPSGTSETPFPFAIYAYPLPGCAGTAKPFIFAQGLQTPDTTDNLIYDYTASNPDTTRIYLRHPLVTTLAAVNSNFLIPAEASYPMDLSKFVTGVTGTVNFSVTGSGTLSGNIYTHNGTPEAISVTASDDSGASVNFTMNALAAVAFQDFNTRTSFGWTSTRASTSGKTMNNSSFQQQATPNTARFIYDNSDGTYGLVSEGPRTNFVRESGLVYSSPWVNSGTGTSNGSFVYTSPVASDLTDNNGGMSTYTSQSMSGLSLTPHTLSLYVKKAPGFAGIYLGSTTTNCMGLVMDTNTGSAINMQDGSVCTQVGHTYVVEAVNATWWRVSMTRTLSSTTPSVRIYPAWSGSLNSVTNISAMGTITVDGVQLEEGSSSSSNISTVSTALNRDGDKLTNPTFGTNINNVEGTILIKWRTKPEASLGYIFQTYNVSNPSESQLRIRKNANDQLAVDFLHDGGDVRSIAGAGVIGDATNTAILSYSANEILLKRGGNATIYTADRSGTTTTQTYNGTSLGSDRGTENFTTQQLTKKIVHWNAHFPAEVLNQMLP